MGKDNVTVYDIAKEAGVSPATVSRVLTGNAAVSDEKRMKVEEVIKKHDFQPNALARSLSKKESKIIGVILPDITNPFFSSVFIEAEKLALKSGYTMILCDSMSNNELEFLYLRSLSEKQVDAIIFMGGRVNDVKTKAKYAEEMNQILKRTPIVLVNGKMTGVDCYKVVAEEEKGIEELVEHLIALGHTKIGMLGGKTSVTSTYIKHKAFEKALHKHGLEVNKNWILTNDFSMEAGALCMKKILELEDKPTAVMAINDLVGVGVIQAAKEAGLNVPGDIAVTGFDGVYISKITDPPLTTVSQNYEGIGKAVIETILDIVNKRETSKIQKVRTKLIIRSSSQK